MFNFRVLFVASAIASGLFSGVYQLQAAEGMFPFNRLPLKILKEKLGFEPTKEWIENAQRASVRFPNGSGSFISPTGLVLTNHHVALEKIQALSTKQRDLVKNGFLAAHPGEELKAPNMELNVLTEIIDVTARIRGAVKPGMSAGEAFKAREEEALKIEEEYAKKTGLRSDVMTFHNGLQYDLYQYKRYTDVRLVFAPEKAMGFFGGDKDNFEFPRYALDMTIFRVYENDKPIRVKNFFPISQKGAEEDQYVFTSGHPGSTSRMMTSPAINFEASVAIPYTMEILERRVNALREYAKKGEEQQRQAGDEIFSLENTLKVYKSRRDFLSTDAFLNLKREQEAGLNQKDQAAGSKYKVSDRLKAVDALYISYIDRLPRTSIISNGTGFNSDYMKQAQDLVRLALQSSLPSYKRDKRFTDAFRPTLMLSIESVAPIYAEMEIEKLTDSLELIVERLERDYPADVKIILNGETPRQAATRLVSGTKIGDVQQRLDLVKGGIDAIRNSTDPFIQLALRIEPLIQEIKDIHREKLLAPMAEALSNLAAARQEYWGDSYPDATFTLRLSYGKVAGYTEEGEPVTPFTSISGLFLDAKANEGGPEYIVPEKWLAARAAGKLNLRTPFNLVSENDIVGGNSGSPIIDMEGSIVSIAFDGNKFATGDVNYRAPQEKARTLSVDCRVMISALKNVYGAEHLLNEMVIK